MAKPKADLTPKQQAFVDEYVLSFNATDAARKAGYSGNDKTLAQIGMENLRKPDIQAALGRRTHQALAKREKRIVNVYEEFQDNLLFVQKLRDACQRWLLEHDTEADDFTIEPRASEVRIVWYTYETAKPPKQHIDRLDVLLAKLEDEGDIPEPAPFIKTTDLREFALKTIDRIDTCLDKFAKMGGLYQQERPNDEAIVALVRSYVTLTKMFVEREGREPTPAECELIIEMVLKLNGRRVEEDAFRKAIKVHEIEATNGNRP